MAPWWVDSRIQATVTRSFVQSHLLPDEIESLDRPVAFGDEQLTERTYWDSIRQDAPRLFLILVDLGVPDQIFGVIDDGWDDAELPVPLEDVDRLQLTAARDERVERRFFQRQFHYLINPLHRGQHVVYAEHEVVPVDVVDRASLTSHSHSHSHSHKSSHKASSVDKVRLPNGPDSVLYRRKYPLGPGPGPSSGSGSGSGCISVPEFLDAVQSVKAIQSQHIVSYWASYTHRGFGYILLTPVSDYSLKSFLSTTPSSFKTLPKTQRRELIANWILCLVDTLCYLHSKNQSHRYIKPSTILFTSRNQILFADSSRLTRDGPTHQADKSSFDREWYDYAAPEQWFRPGAPSSPPGRLSVYAATSADEGPFGMGRNTSSSGSSSGGMFATPNPQLSPQQADVFSLGCIILELLSFLVKRSTSKFASFRSAKHKTAGRGGAVLDTSFHHNLGQVELWMSGLAKDAAKKVNDSEGGNIFKGVTPMLHVVTSMLSANPYDRPTAVEVQRQIYQIVTEVCGATEPHCVNHYHHDLDYSLGQLSVNTSETNHRASAGYGTPRSFQHGRAASSSSGSFSQASQTTISSEAEAEADTRFSPDTAGPSSQQRVWVRGVPYMANGIADPDTLYATKT